MHALTLGRAEYLDAAKETKGQKGSELIRQLARREQRLRLLSADTHEEVQEVLEEGERSPEQIEQQRNKAMEEIMRVTRGGTVLRLHLPEEAKAQKKMLEESADELAQAQKDLKPLEQSRTEEHEGGIAGTAYQERAGSETHDARKVQGETTIVDAVNAAGLGAHEHEHTKQARQTISAIKIEEDHVTVVDAPQDTRDPNIITMTDFSETGAIGAQEEAARESVGFLSDHYQERYAKVLKFASREEVRNMARLPDGMEQFAKKAMKKAE